MLAGAGALDEATLVAPPLVEPGVHAGTKPASKAKVTGARVRRADCFTMVKA